MKNFITIAFLLFFSFSFAFAQQGEGNMQINNLDPILEEVSSGEVQGFTPSVSTRIIPRGKIVDFGKERERIMVEAQKGAIEVGERAKEIRMENLQQTEARQKLLREKAEEIGGEQLRNRFEILSENMNRVNYNLSNRYTGLLFAMEIVLNKIESRTAKIEIALQKDLSSVYLKVDEARNSIEVAKEEIAEQKAKTYVPDISSGEDVGLQFQNVLQEIRTDHNTLRIRTIDAVKFLIREIMAELRSAIIN